MADTSVKLATYNLVLTGTSSCLSIFGGIIIIATFFIIKDIRRYFTRQLLIYLTIADLFTAVGNFIAVIRYAYVHQGEDAIAENCTATKVTPYGDLCVSQSFLTTFSNLASFLWTAVIAVHLWSSVMIRTRLTEVYYLHALYHVICWAIPHLFTAVGNLSAVIRYVYVHDGNDTVIEKCTAYNITQPDDFCVSQSFLTTFSNLASFLWTAVIAVHLWSTIVIRTRQTEMHYLHAVYHVVCWIVPFAIVTILLNKNYLGEDFRFGTGVWCGIRCDLPPREIKRWMYIADIGWQIACYLTACFLYIHVKFYLRLHKRSRQLASLMDTLRNEDENFVFAWMVIYLLKLWGFTRFFITTYVDPEVLQRQSMKTFLDFLLAMQSYGASGQAFWNFILFCVLDKTVRKHMKNWFKLRGSGEENEGLFASNRYKVHC